MKHYTAHIRALLALSAALLLSVAITTGAFAATSQTFTLHPGWNAVYLEVQPDEKAPAEVFKNLPVESVWTWFDRNSSVEFIRDPSEGLWAQPGWSVYSTAPEKAAAINLFAIFANRAYLIKLGGTQTVTWSVTGTAATDATVWTPNSFNLAGFHVNPANPPTFETYLSSSPSHKGQQIYSLSPQGVWERIANPAVTAIKPGEAYWVYCSGSSTYQGPVNVQVLGGELDFGITSRIKSITLINDSAATRTVTITYQPSFNWFTYQSFNASTGLYEYLKLDSWTRQLSAGRQSKISFAVRRELLANGFYQGTLQVTDDLGTRMLIPVTVEEQAL